MGFADPDLTLEEVKEKVDELHHEAEVAAERYHLATDELEWRQSIVFRALESLPLDLEPAGTLQKVVSFDLKEEGNHVCPTPTIRQDCFRLPCNQVTGFG